MILIHEKYYHFKSLCWTDFLKYAFINFLLYFAKFSIKSPALQFRTFECAQNFELLLSSNIFIVIKLTVIRFYFSER